MQYFSSCCKVETSIIGRRKVERGELGRSSSFELGRGEARGGGRLLSGGGGRGNQRMREIGKGQRTRLGRCSLGEKGNRIMRGLRARLGVLLHLG